MSLRGEPQLFVIRASEIATMLDERILSARVALDEVKAAMEAETVEHVKEKIFPGAIKAIEAEIRDAEFLATHLGAEDTHRLSAEELINLRDRLQPMTVDITRLRLAKDEIDPDSRKGRSQVVPATPAGLSEVIKRAGEIKRH